MKKKHFIFTTVCLLAGCSGGFLGGITKSTSNESSLTMENVEALTDNRNRTAGEVRHYFDKFCGNMGTQGCVSFMFSKKGVLVIEREDLEKDEDTVMSDALECGASDFEADDDVFTIYTETDDFGAVRDELEKLGYTFVSAEIEMVPSTYTKLEDEETATKMQKMLDMFEDNDDIQNVWHNWEMD